jgi:hypothetical protein
VYAETFNVRPWLETPAKWLRWAMQSLQAGNSTDARYNLQQFWNTLATAKGQARTQQDWSEILTLDAQSQWTLGNLYQADASDTLKKLNLVSIGGPLAPGDAVDSLKTKLAQLQQNAQTAFDAQVTLAAQAKQAAAAAGVQSQAAATLTVGKNAQASAVNDRAFQNRQAANMTSNTDLFSTKFMGLPLWAWLAGGAALLLLVTTAPAMAEASAIRRAAED